jgi:hypothetical protein
MSEDVAANNADALDRVLARQRQTLGCISADGECQHHAQALALMERYAGLLREPIHAPASPGRYWFKLVFPDGRWSVDEKQLADRPHDGDVVAFDAHGIWQVQIGTQRVMPRPAGKPPREFLICAPAA